MKCEVAGIGGHAHVNVSIGGTLVRALVNTGACRTLLNENINRDMCRANHRRPIVKLASHGLRSVSVHDIKVVGLVQIDVKNAGLMEMMVS